MVYERVRYIQIPTTTALTVDDNGNFEYYTESSLDGRIQKIQWELPATAVPDQAGSVEITVSGVGERILLAKNIFNATWDIYPRVSISNNLGVSPLGNASGGNIWTEFVCRDAEIRINGSGFGGIGSGIGIFKIFYY